MRNLRAKLNKENGFTLIEMLIVVAIIAILIAIAIPMVNSALERAREATDSANERAALGLAMVEVLSDNKLGATAPETDKPVVVAYYTVKNSKGSFATGKAIAAPGSGDPVHPDTAPTATEGGGYGKGTKAAPDTTSRAGLTLYVAYNTETGDFTTGWK